jgi:hypothetical protein
MVPEANVHAEMAIGGGAEIRGAKSGTLQTLFNQICRLTISRPPPQNVPKIFHVILRLSMPVACRTYLPEGSKPSSAAWHSESEGSNGLTHPMNPSIA